jgi:hypothetical protein
VDTIANIGSSSSSSYGKGPSFSLRPEQRVALFTFLIQELVAGALNSKEEVSWIVLCSVLYRGQRMA